MSKRDTGVARDGSPPLFMSQPHIDEMNRLLSESDAMRRMCAEFQEAYRIEYLLTNGPGGKEVTWRLDLTPERGVQMGLGADGQSPDLAIRADYSSMVRASRAAREGKPSESNSVTYHGDTSLLQKLQPILQRMREVATVQVTWPELGED